VCASFSVAGKMQEHQRLIEQERGWSTQKPWT